MGRRMLFLAGGLAAVLAVVAVGVMLRTSTAEAGAAPMARAGEDKEAPPKMAASRITQVVVYPDSALVTREVEVPAGNGLVEVVVNPLPHCTINSSLYSEGSEGLRVLSTRFRTRPVREDTREEVRKLEEELKKLEMNVLKNQADMRACESNTQLLTKLEGFASASTTHATEKGKMDSDATIALAKYLMEGRAEKTRELTSMQMQQQTLNEQMEFTRRKLRDLTAGTSKTENDAVIIVDKVNGAPGKVRLNYLVSAASWKPQYKFRAGKTAKDAVAIEYLAGIMQQTGEDWSRVDLTLSTAQPMLNASPPELRALAVAIVPRGGAVAANAPQIDNNLDVGKDGRVPMGAFANPMGRVSGEQLQEAAQKLRQRAQSEFNRKNEKGAAEITNYAANLDQARDLVLHDDKKPMAGPGGNRAPRNEGPSVTYHLTNQLSIPSRNDDQVIEVAKLDMDPDYFYKAVPVLSPHVYRQATLTNKSKYVLLPGEATMYHGNDFVGRMNLPLVAIGEEFVVGFGAEPQLQVSRQMVDKTRSMQGGNQILKYDYRLLVSSYKPEKVKVQVWDRLPQAENEAMGVNLIKATPEVCKDPVYVREDRPNNLLRWDLDIDPDMKGEKALKINYEFKLELDKQATIGSFQSR